MSSHANRSAYFVCNEGILRDPDLLFHPSAEFKTKEDVATVHLRQTREPQFKFGRMFDIENKAAREKPKEEVIGELLALAASINARMDNAENDSDIPAGYTYLGQFIAHEITFDKTEEPLDANLANPGYRSPQLDLDSLYGQGPETKTHRHCYQDRARLKVGETIAGGNLRRTFYNDLPRFGFGSPRIGQALIPDQRNDENLTVAQTHVAFIKFHNKVVDAIHLGDESPDNLFEAAKKDVIQHFQWIILKDFLPTLLHEEGSQSLRTGEPTLFKPDSRFGVVMPLEFSVAAFRFGHSMVRNQYEWNYFQNSKNESPASLRNLFRFTGFSGDLHRKPRLESDWIIDWRRFFDLSASGYPTDDRASNKARKIDSSFSLRLENIPGFPHVTENLTHQSIVARNLLRGYACGLPSGEKVAKAIGVEELKQDQIGIDSPHLRGNTPLWYYILKEAENNNGKLGPVASFIIAETLVGLIKESPYSILKEKDWKPKYGPRFNDGIFEMADLLAFSEVVDPVGEHMGRQL